MKQHWDCRMEATTAAWLMVRCRSKSVAHISGRRVSAQIVAGLEEISSQKKNGTFWLIAFQDAYLCLAEGANGKGPSCSGEDTSEGRVFYFHVYKESHRLNHQYKYGSFEESLIFNLK